MPLKLTECADCPDAATRKAIAAISSLGALEAIKTTNNGQFRVSGSVKTIADNGRIELSPDKDAKFDRTLCYVVAFERGEAKITVAVRGTDQTREVAMMHIRPVAPAAFAPVTLGKLEPWIWEKATTW